MLVDTYGLKRVQSLARRHSWARLLTIPLRSIVGSLRKCWILLWSWHRWCGIALSYAASQAPENFLCRDLLWEPGLTSISRWSAVISLAVHQIIANWSLGPHLWAQGTELGRAWNNRGTVEKTNTPGFYLRSPTRSHRYGTSTFVGAVEISSWKA